MSQHYAPPSFEAKAFNCPFCGAYAKQDWFFGIKTPNQNKPLGGPLFQVPLGAFIRDFHVSECSNCGKNTFWMAGHMAFPNFGNTPLPNVDMPDDVRVDYEEARNITSLSPRGAAALLRLAIQKLCKHLGEPGKNINSDIGSLVKKGLPEKIQKALDSVRVVGNNAVHPGQIDFNDDEETTNKLFAFINVICENQISQPKQIDAYYSEKIPSDLRDEIAKRDKR